MFQIYYFIRYWLAAKDEHGIHSPFLFDLYNRVINNSKHFTIPEIEALRRQLLKDETCIRIRDLGTGPDRNIKIKKVAASAVSPLKYSGLQYRLIQHFKPVNIIEIGTSLGINSAYMANAYSNSSLYTFEGSETIAALARQHFRLLNIENIKVVTGNFDDTLSAWLPTIGHIDYAFIDGNHTYEATLFYFEMIIRFSSENLIITVDDIYWSREMNRAWEQIKQNQNVTLTIDLYHFGIVFLSKKLSKQNLILKF